MLFLCEHALNKNETFSLKATVLPSNATDKIVVWSSSNPKVATVQNGVITAVGGGTATITAKTSDGKLASAKVTVNVNASSVSLSTKDIYIGVNETLTLKAIPTPSDATNKITWTSSNNNIVSVANGKVTGNSNGTATVTAKTSNGKSASCKVTVRNAPTSVALNPNSLTAGVGENIKLSLKLPQGSSSNTRTFLSSNTNVCTVDRNGNVKAKSVGNAKITVTLYNGKTATCNVTVKQPADKITLNSNINLLVGEKTKLDVYTSDDHASYNNTYKSSNSDILSIDNTGMMTDKKTGDVTVTVKTYNGKSASGQIHISAAASKIEFSRKSLWLGTGENFPLANIIHDGDLFIYYYRIKFSSSNNDVCSVDEKGNLKAKKNRYCHYHCFNNRW